MGEIVGNQGVLPGDMPKARQIQHWGMTLSQMVNLADLYYQLPLHVFVTGLTKHVTIEAMGQILYNPSLWGQSALELPSLAELVGRVQVLESLVASKAMALKRDMPEEFEGAHNVLLTKGGRTFMGKWQGVRKNPEVIVNPSIGKIMEILQEQSTSGE
jgi:hypothetical protein